MARYSDIRAKFGQDTSSKKVLATDLEAILEAINNLLTTSRNERLFRPEIWSDLDNLLFEPISEAIAYDIMDEIDRLISRWEPRVTLLMGKSSIKPDYDNETYEVRLIFSVLGLDGEQEYRTTLGDS